MNQVLLAVAYFPPIEFYCHLAKSNSIIIEQKEHFIKQTYRSRCSILGANGPLDLSIPIEKHPNNTPIRDIKISYTTEWQKQHWRSIVSAYNSSSYFMYYDYELEPFFQKKHTYLFDLNMEIMNKLNKLLKIPVDYTLTSEYKALDPTYSDFRHLISPKTKPELLIKNYNQVFDQKFGFIENLSILDLLFNQGPHSKEFL